jgi:hypothetical protein
MAESLICTSSSSVVRGIHRFLQDLAYNDPWLIAVGGKKAVVSRLFQ